MDFPVNKSFILSSNRIKILLIWPKFSSHYMFWMTNINFWSWSHSTRISKEINLTIISCSCNQFTIWRSISTINIGTILSTRIDTINIITKFSSLSCPLFILKRWSTTCLLWSIRIPIEEFVSTTNSSEVLRICTPIETMNIWTMSFTFPY